MLNGQIVNSLQSPYVLSTQKKEQKNFPRLRKNNATDSFTIQTRKKSQVGFSANYIKIGKELLNGFSKKIPISDENLSEASLALVRLTDDFPTEGVIKSARKATKNSQGVGAFRNSVHFSLNHAVMDNNLNFSWKESKYAIIMPYDKTVKLNGDNKIIGGTPTDIFTNGSVKLPENTVIVRQNSKIPEGQLKVLNNEEVDGLKTAKGVKVIETADNVHNVTDNIIEMMGYTKKQGNTPYGWGVVKPSGGIQNLVKNINLWKKFVRSKGIKDAIHLYTPSARAEHMIEGIELLTQENSWNVINNGKEVINYKKEFLNVIDDIKKSSEKGYKLNFDVDKLGEIIKKADTPQKAMKKISGELKLKSIFNLSQLQRQVGITGRKLTPVEIYRNIDVSVGISSEAKKLHSQAINFFEKNKVDYDDYFDLTELGDKFQRSLTNNSIINKWQN